MDVLALEEILEKTLEGIDCALYDVAFLKENQTDILESALRR